ncbi:MAG: DUF2283 domain-containing protein [Chloroflexi bacterium]|nr:DUF2283 domain-containing protein [Chloroflexota bacterium]
MKISYDPEVDAAYISFKVQSMQVTIVRLTEDIAVDFGPGDEVVGIEILDASEHLQFDRRKPGIKLENLEVA